MSGFRGRLSLVAFAVVLVVVGGVLLRGAAGGRSADPAASVTNGAPRGLLALRLLLAAEGRDVEVRTRFRADAESAVGRGQRAPRVLLVPPPERTAWTDEEARSVLAGVAGGHRLVIVCDDEDVRNARLGALLTQAGAECYRADVAIGDQSVTAAESVFDVGAPLFVRGTGRARPQGRSSLLPLIAAGTEAVVLAGPHGAGDVVVVGSATVIANDGLAQQGNSAFALTTLAPLGSVIEVDERHHTSRVAMDVRAAARQGSGPFTAAVALVLLVPLSLLSLVPRPGDPPPPDDGMSAAPAAVGQVHALAALLEHARHTQHRRWWRRSGGQQRPRAQTEASSAAVTERSRGWPRSWRQTP